MITNQQKLFDFLERAAKHGTEFIKLESNYIPYYQVYYRGKKVVFKLMNVVGMTRTPVIEVDDCVLIKEEDYTSPINWTNFFILSNKEKLSRILEERQDEIDRRESSASGWARKERVEKFVREL